MIEGTVVNEVCSAEAIRKGEIRIGHPSGVLEVFVDVKNSVEQGWTLLQAGVCRTARPIMDGEVYVRITSYNVCYTKLLRSDSGVTDFRYVGF